VESVVPEEAAWEDEPGGRCGVGYGLLFLDEGVLGVEGTVVVGDAA
jgi:hypothetical protein